MNILIVTSRNHTYANVVLIALAHTSLLRAGNVWIMEQSALVPGKSRWYGLWKYMRVSGCRYVYWQIIKQYRFLWSRWIAQVTGDTTSPYFPYWLLRGARRWRRETVNGIHAKSVVRRIQHFHPDYIVSIFSKEILKPSLLSIPSHGVVNLHPALLPSYRGVSPVFWCMANGEKRTGATIHCMQPVIDTGRIIAQRSFSLETYHTEHDVYMKSAAYGATLLTSWFREGCPIRHTHTRLTRVQSGYYSLPTKNAVRQFFERGYRFL